METSMMLMSESDSSNDSIVWMSNSKQKPKRKRQRLDHLSQEEKLMRRKLKNRMAAQSARDRKKVKMQDLEQEVTLLEKQRNVLHKQNESLKQRNAFLEQQNKELLKRISVIEEKQTIKSENNCSDVWCETFKSAVLINGPLQWEQVSQPDRQTLAPMSSMTPFVYWLIIKNLMLYSMFFTSILKNCSNQTLLTTMTSNCRQTMASDINKYHQQKRHHSWDQLKT